MLLGPMSQYMPNAPLSLSGSQDVAVVVTPGHSSTLQASVLTPPEPRGDQGTPGAGLATELHVVPAPALGALAAAGLDAQLLQPDGRLEPCVPGVGNGRCLHNPCILGWVAPKWGSRSWTEVSHLVVGV